MFFSNPSVSLSKGSSTSLPKPFFNGLYTPFGSPVSGGQKPQGTRDVAGSAIAPPEFWYRKRSLCPKGLAMISYATE